LNKTSIFTIWRLTRQIQFVTNYHVTITYEVRNFQVWLKQTSLLEASSFLFKKYGSK